MRLLLFLILVGSVAGCSNVSTSELVRAKNNEGYCQCVGDRNADSGFSYQIYKEQKCGKPFENCQKPTNYTIYIENVEFCLDQRVKNGPSSKFKLFYRLEKRDGSCRSKEVYISPTKSGCDLKYGETITIRSCAEEDDKEFLDAYQDEYITNAGVIKIERLAQTAIRLFPEFTNNKKVGFHLTFDFVQTLSDKTERRHSVDVALVYLKIKKASPTKIICPNLSTCGKAPKLTFGGRDTPPCVNSNNRSPPPTCSKPKPFIINLQHITYCGQKFIFNPGEKLYVNVDIATNPLSGKCSRFSVGSNQTFLFTNTSCSAKLNEVIPGSYCPNHETFLVFSLTQTYPTRFDGIFASLSALDNTRTIVIQSLVKYVKNGTMNNLKIGFKGDEFRGILTFGVTLPPPEEPKKNQTTN